MCAQPKDNRVTTQTRLNSLQEQSHLWIFVSRSIIFFFRSSSLSNYASQSRPFLWLKTQYIITATIALSLPRYGDSRALLKRKLPRLVSLCLFHFCLDGISSSSSSSSLLPSSHRRHNEGIPPPPPFLLASARFPLRRNITPLSYCVSSTLTFFFLFGFRPFVAP